MKKAKMSIKNIYSYLLGNFRYELYYSKYSWLLRTKVREQIEARIASMDQECYTGGSCIMCGCKTTALQMANKACDKPCYPEMLGSRQWTLLKAGYKITDSQGISWKLVDNKFYKYDGDKIKK